MKKSKKANRRRRGAKVCATGVSVALISATAVLADARPAFACAFGGYYTGQSTNQNWEGVERHIAIGGGSLYLNNQSVSAWMGVNNNTKNCVYGRVCSLQAGYFSGYDNPQLQNTGSPNSYDVYSESNDAFGYQASTFPSYGDVNDFFTVFYDGITLSFPGLTVYEYKDYVNDGSLHLLHTVDMMDQSNEVEALIELHGDGSTGSGSETCPTVGDTYFGVNNSNAYDTNWSIYKSADDHGWHEWVVTPDTSLGAGTYGNIHQWSSYKVRQP